MDESVLERWNDFISDESSNVKTEEVNEELSGEPFLSLHPDEHLPLHTDSSTGLNHNSQNSTAAAELPGGVSVGEPAASPVRPTSPVKPVTQQPQIILQIQNVLSTMKLGCCLDLNLIARKSRNVQYNPKTHKALIMRIRDPRATALIYQSGIIVCAGAKSVEQSRLAARKFARIVQKLGFPIRSLLFKIQNVVARCSTFPLRLELLALHHSCSYEPELFSGLFLRVKPGVTATVFSSGKLMLMGAKGEAELYEVLDTVYPILTRFKR